MKPIHTAKYFLLSICLLCTQAFAAEPELLAARTDTSAALDPNLLLFLADSEALLATQAELIELLSELPTLPTETSDNGQ